MLTTTRRLEPSGLTDKTRVLDAKQTGGPEIEAMRARWAELQNHALERQGHEARLDHRSLAVQREAALAQGHELRAEELDRPAEVKLGPAASAIERREQQAAELEGRDYAPVTERGAAVHAVRQERALLAELRMRVELARETYVHAREEGVDRVTAGLAALRTAAQKHAIEQEHERNASPEHVQGHAAEAESIRERLARIVDRRISQTEPEAAQEHRPEQDDIRARLGRILGRKARQDHEEPEVGVLDPSLESRSIRERLQEVLARDKPVTRERPDREHGHERDEVRHRHREQGHDDEWGL